MLRSMKKIVLLTVCLLAVICTLYACVSNPNQERELGKPNILSVYVDIDSITVKANSQDTDGAIAIEYKLDDGEWYGGMELKEHTFSGLNFATEYTVYVSVTRGSKRSAAASQIVKTLKADNTTNPTNIAFTQSGYSITITESNLDLEFSFDGVAFGDIKTHVYAEGQKIGTARYYQLNKVYFRYKATENHNASPTNEVEIRVGNFEYYNEGVYYIKTKEQFVAVASENNYCMLNDIDFDGQILEHIIANSVGLDGGGYKIKNFKFRITESSASGNSYRVGLFGELIFVKNLIVENASIESTNVWEWNNMIARIGVFAGSLSGIAENCQVSGEITIDSKEYLADIGGLFGYVENSSSILNCASLVNITATGGNVGGIAGVFSGSIDKSFYNGNISVIRTNGDGIVQVGGLVAIYLGNLTITDCYSAGNITLSHYSNNTFNGNIVVAGIATDARRISNCYSSMVISATASGYVNAGGLAIGLLEEIYKSFFGGNITVTSTTANPNGIIVGAVAAPLAYVIDNSAKVVNCYYLASTQISATNASLHINSYGTIASMDNFESEVWIKEILEWSGDVWTFVANELPALN